MKAIRFNQTGSLSELRVTSMAQPVPRHGEVLVKVQAAAINPSDVKNVLGRMNQTTFPRTPGRDFAGLGFVECANVLRGLLHGIESGEFKPPELETVTLDGAVSAYRAINSGTARKKQVIVF
jgi:hypothetical protein